MPRPIRFVGRFASDQPGRFAVGPAENHGRAGFTAGLAIMSRLIGLGEEKQ
ncbi:hypothetical protein D3C80_2080200 [compost metagenome]